MKTRRVTKKQLQAQRQFIETIETHLLSIGAVVKRPALSFDEATAQGERYRASEWLVDTPFGPLNVHPILSDIGPGWVATSFELWDVAKRFGFRHWKWNHHYNDGFGHVEAANDFCTRLDQLRQRTDGLTKEQWQPLYDAYLKSEAERWEEIRKYDAAQSATPQVA